MSLAIGASMALVFGAWPTIETYVWEAFRSWAQQAVSKRDEAPVASIQQICELADGRM